MQSFQSLPEEKVVSNHGEHKEVEVKELAVSEAEGTPLIYI